MKKYIIKIVSKATENNENFKGKTQVWYKGCKTTTEAQFFGGEKFVEKYGYKSKAGAVRALKSANRLAVWENKKGFWQTTCDLLEYNF